MPSVTSLAAISSTSIFNTMARVADENGLIGDYFWLAGDVTADDGIMVIAPTDGGPGRWRKII